MKLTKYFSTMIFLAGLLLAGPGCLRVVTAPLRAERAEKAEAAFARLAAFTPEQIAGFLDARLAEKLELTVEQRTKLAPINLDYARRLQATAATTESVRSKARDLRDEGKAHEEALRGVLTAKQIARYLEMKEQMRDALQDGNLR
jgi:hypothetical protein